MDKQIKELLENEVLGEDVKSALQEAFNNKIKAAEQQLQEDYAARYSNDKAALVEAMDRMLTDAIRTELLEFAEDRTALIKQRAKLSEQTGRVRKQYARKLAEHAAKLDGFVSKNLRSEIAEFVEDRKSLERQRREMALEMKEIKESTKTELGSRINKLESFVLKQLSEEIAEFQADKKALVEQRIKLAQEGKQRIAEAKTQFIERASSAVDRTLNEVIRNELVQWKDDIKLARQNNFGRRIFEAVAAEYMTSYLSEGSEVKKLTRQLQEKEAALNEARADLEQKSKLMESADAKIRTANDRVQRMQMLNELLAPLTRDKKTVMEDLLKDIKTQNLREAFQRYLPAVVNSARVPQKVPLSEASSTPTTPVAKTGNRDNTLAKAVIEETKPPHDLGVILHLAGIKN